MDVQLLYYLYACLRDILEVGEINKESVYRWIFEILSRIDYSMYLFSVHSF